MKVSLNRESLLETLGLVTSIVPARTPKPILQCLHLSAQKDEVRISATDLDVGINCLVMHAQVESAGDIVIPAGRFLAIVRESVDDVISLEASENTCSITGTDSHFTVYGHDPSQFPQVPDFQGEAHFEVNILALQEAIAKTLFAVAKESTRYAINGLLWELDGKKLVLIATDGRRLAKCRLNLASAPAKSLTITRAIAPAKTMFLLEKLTGTEKDAVAVRLHDNRLMMQCGSVVISSNLVEGNFPKYEDIIPVDYDKKIVLNTAAVLSAVRRAALLVSEESRGIKLSITDNAISFSSRAPETGDAKIDMAVKYKGEPIEVGFNPQFLVDVLRVIKAEEFDLELGDAEKPGLIKAGPNFLYVVMPINLG